MQYSGFADEAGSSIEVQIRATQDLGWHMIEARNIGSTNITDISDGEFDEAAQRLAAAGIKIHCFGSAVANWGTDPRREEDFQRSMESLRRAIPRMHRLGTKFIRGMSFGIVRDEQPDSPQLEKMIFEKVRALVRICEENGVVYLHENCMNYGGLSYQHTLKLMEAVNSPNFRLVFDTGNPVGSDNRIGDPPYRKQSSWEFYRQVKDYVVHVHIKDCIFIEETDGLFPKLEHTFPGEGHGDVAQIVDDLIASRYEGVLSIEPHLAVVYHDDTVQSAEEIRYQNYVEYGKRLMALVDQLEKRI